MTDPNNPFSLIDEQIEIQKNKSNEQKEKSICERCKNVLARKCFDGVINTFVSIECKYSQLIDIEKFPVLECTQFDESHN